MSTPTITPRERVTLPARVVARLERRRSSAAGTHRARPQRGGRGTERRNAIRESLAAH